jgi:hypothetical protein
MAGGAGSGISKGGMITKVRAAQRAARSGAHTLIASGREPDVLPRLAHGEALGTLLFASATPLAARKQWLADHLQLAGSLILDAGAVKALASGKSLLPVGVTAVKGSSSAVRRWPAVRPTAARSPAAWSIIPVPKRAASRGSPARRLKPSSATSTSRTDPPGQYGLALAAPYCDKG